MTTIKVKFRPSTITGKEGSIYYQVIHDRKARQILTRYKIFPAEWDNRNSTMIMPESANRQTALYAIKEKIHWDCERLQVIIRRLQSNRLSYSIDDIIAEFDHYTRSYSLFIYTDMLIAKLCEQGKYRTAQTYASTLNSFKRYRNGKDIIIDNITSEIIESYEAYLHSKRCLPNTTSFYMRKLRAIYNRAAEEGLIVKQNPFKRVFTGIEKTTKRAVPLEILKKIKRIRLVPRSKMDFAHDMFLMSLYLQGISPIDLAFLKKSDLRNGRIIYRRSKTGQILNIKWTKDMQFILDKYPDNPTEYLMPIINKTGIDERKTYKNMCYNINYNLRKLGMMVGLEAPLTLYCARHSWASIAQSIGIPLSVIKEGLGHNSETTTLIYLASLDTSVVDGANSKILNCLNDNRI